MRDLHSFPTRRSSDLTGHYVIAHGRHLLFALPPLLLWTANGLWSVSRPVAARFRPAAAIALPVLFTLVYSYTAIEIRVDRKSTRLNSSHSSISYAVFC